MVTKIRLYVRTADDSWHRKILNIESDLPKSAEVQGGRLKIDDHWLEHVRLVAWDEDDGRWMAVCGEVVPDDLVTKPGWQATEKPG